MTKLNYLKIYTTLVRTPRMTYNFPLLSDVRLTKDGYRVSFPKKKCVSEKDFLIPVGTKEWEIFHCYFSILLSELKAKPGEKLWRTGVEAIKNKPSYFMRAPLGDRKIRRLPRYIANKLGYDSHINLEFKLYHENESDEVLYDNGDKHKSPKPSEDLTVDSFDDNDPKISEPKTKKSSLKLDTSHLDELIKDLEPIICLGINPYELDSAPLFLELPKDSQRKYYRVWCEFLEDNDIRLGHPPTFAQLYGFLEKAFKEGKKPTTIVTFNSHINMGLHLIYNRKMKDWSKFAK